MSVSIMARKAQVNPSITFVVVATETGHEITVSEGGTARPEMTVKLTRGGNAAENVNFRWFVGQTVAKQVTTAAGRARHVNAVENGALRCYGENGRFFTGGEIE